MGRKKSKSMATSIAKVVPSDLVEDLNKITSRRLPLFTVNISGAKKALDAKETERWAIVMCWVAYKRAPIIDITRKPYNTPAFLRWKYYAYALNTQLDLCQIVFDSMRKYKPDKFDQLRDKYQNPFLWWVDCMMEYRSIEGQRFEPELKQEGFLARLKKHVKLLSCGQSQENSGKTPENENLFNLAAWLMKRDSEVENKVRDYCFYFNKFIQKDAKNLYCYWIDETNNRLIVMARLKYSAKPVFTSCVLARLKNNQTKLSIITQEPWSEQQIYVLAARAN